MSRNGSIVHYFGIGCASTLFREYRPELKIPISPYLNIANQSTVPNLGLLNLDPGPIDSKTD